MPHDSQPQPIEIIRNAALRDEAALVQRLVAEADLSPEARAAISAQGAELVTRIRKSAKPGLMEVFLAEYGLSTDEGIALMCLAEALLRVPDAETMDALIEDKIAPSDWGRHLGRSASSLVNASTWALMLTGKVLEEREPGVAGHLRAAVKRLGEPVIRRAVAQAMKEMGRNFVLGETIERAMDRARDLEAKGYTYSYDMLGEAARTEGDARRYHLAYTRAITAIAAAARGNDIRANPGISVKLSALHPRYEVAKRARVMAELVPRVRALAGLARAAGIGFNIDAEEADRLELSLEVIEAVLDDASLAGWDGFGVVVQAYGRRAGAVIDWLHDLAGRLDRRIMVRLVKGAYWDAEVKRAQVLGLESFPVFTRKEATDVSYIANARKLLGMTGRIYPQFATHNAHTVAAVLQMASAMGVEPLAYEFQRLHGMGERLHDIVLSDQGTRCRIYAPVGAHRDLLAYLVRRLLENGANSSFVNQIVDEDVPPARVAACPLTAVEAMSLPNKALLTGPELFGTRRNARGFDLTAAPDLAAIEAARAPFADHMFEAAPMLAGRAVGGMQRAVINPATGVRVGFVTEAAAPDIDTALRLAEPWAAEAGLRAEVLRRAADLYEAEFGPIFALLAREAGKTQADAVAELREAVDFLRYYADGAGVLRHPCRGVFACISPWNFPLAIFTGQIAAALAAGNAVLAKPAEQTPLIAALAVGLLHKAGVPLSALQLLPGDGAVGAALTADARVAGVAFTGGTETALKIRASMAAHLAPGAPLIAETGGLNAMVVDSTALPEQAVRDILASSFQSAGQRCSALRCLYVQEDIAETVLEMLFGAMEDLALGDPWDLATDVGPVIDAEAQKGIADYVAQARAEGRVLKELAAPAGGTFIAPVVLRVPGIAAMPREIFGPVLHVATFRASDLDQVIAAVNATGYGLTFGLHSRIDDRVQQVVAAAQVGNIYVNRNQIGAVVGSQPFGGEGLSGTGPKAGGPHYLHRFTRATAPQGATETADKTAGKSTEADLRARLRAPQAAPAAVTTDLPGPTGESNRLTTLARAPLLCLGPTAAQALAQATAVRALGGLAVEVPGLEPAVLATETGFSGAIWWGDAATARACAQALASRKGPILPLITDLPDTGHATLERHACIDTTASGGNAQLLTEAAG
ncbi:bifunctional proline dehydrogenase/L-glutamate gamma-semialdehyde dehydrogenase PutA [Pseudorhodobacter sp. MZDSW-24AT]|uniref:bifunctional proline dehydrogenase/L-glutamate gamma-semialdehyde dehydrogenase PutA n=1 Tax=Pseudorhodobacter sp. MZDSW-24AT TaxID=2052957 RepID=UPI000C1E4D9A|nr:bifunctional proline dehydrogenase/L-glutamate gamma-semialdehyde dehydrogenase PutA [Pseudorhodobacter sp. MZDSW-24AT]PJF09066.1 bifunctional proline dehydrogenase/L-glutamate gamma-semialdehyde dehydrogenase [Pseudorhodobacter sp. MZDSW-24AT]